LILGCSLTGVSAADEVPPASAALSGGAVPSGDVFEPLWADPVWPQFRLTLNEYVDDDFLGTVVTAGMGDTVPFARWVDDDAPFGLDAFEFGGQAAVFTTFDQDAPSNDQFYADFFGGVYVAGRVGRTSGMLRMIHRSGHVGDEFLLNAGAQAGVTRENFSFERVDLYLSRDLAGDPFAPGTGLVRVYAGVGVSPTEPDPDNYGWVQIQYGLELRSPTRIGPVRPVAAANVTHQSGNDYKADLSVRAGVQFDNDTVNGRAVRLLFEYYNGKEVNGQFWEDDLQYFGFGMFVSF
jgi:hypothetical protein